MPPMELNEYERALVLAYRAWVAKRDAMKSVEGQKESAERAWQKSRTECDDAEQALRKLMPY